MSMSIVRSFGVIIAIGFFFEPIRRRSRETIEEAGDIQTYNDGKDHVRKPQGQRLMQPVTRHALDLIAEGCRSS